MRFSCRREFLTARRFSCSIRAPPLGTFSSWKYKRRDTNILFTQYITAAPGWLTRKLSTNVARDLPEQEQEAEKEDLIDILSLKTRLRKRRRTIIPDYLSPTHSHLARNMIKGSMWDCTESIREIREAEGKEKMEAALKRLKEESSKRECTRKGRPYSSPSFREAASPPLHRLPNDYMPLGHHLLYFPSFNRPSDVMTDGTIPQHHPGLPYGKRLWSGGKVEFKPNWQDKFAMDGRLAICVEKLEDARWPPTVVEKLEKDPAATLDKADQSMIFIDVVRRYGIAPIDIRKQTLNKANISTTISESPDIKETRTLVFFAEDEYAKLTPKKRRGNEPNQEAEKSQYDQNNASTEPAETKRMNRKPKQGK